MYSIWIVIFLQSIKYQISLIYQNIGRINSIGFLYIVVMSYTQSTPYPYDDHLQLIELPSWRAQSGGDHNLER